jgi:hypothetical protein
MGWKPTGTPNEQGKRVKTVTGEVSHYRNEEFDAVLCCREGWGELFHCVLDG